MADPVRTHPTSRSTAVVSRAEAPARPYELRSPVAELLNRDAARAAIVPMLRPGESYDRIVVEVYHAAAKNPEILKCTPQSIVSAVARAVGSGLIIGEGVHLVPFGDRLEMVLDYKGCAELVLMSGAARYLDAQCHYEHEPFEYEQGSSPFIRHRPIVDPKARGALVGAYAVAKVNRDDLRIIYMAVEEIDAIRLAKSKAWKKGPLSAIPWYAKKTVIKQIVKLLPKNRELAKVMALLDREDAADDADGLDAIEPLAIRGSDDFPRAAAPDAPETEAAPPDPAQLDALTDEPEGAGDETATTDDEDGEEPAPPSLDEANRFPCPMGDPPGRPLSAMTTAEIKSCYRIAEKRQEHPAFRAAALRVLEGRS